MKIKSALFLVPALLISSVIFAQELPSSAQAPTMGPQADQAPMTDKEVLTELKKSGPDQLTKDLGTRGVNFEMDEETEKRLRKAKATDQLIQAVKSAGPKERQNAAKAAAQAAGQIVVPEAESNDFKALQSELDPDKAIGLAEAFAKNHPNSPVLSYSFAYEANAYQTKGDVANLVVAAQKSLAVKKDNLMTLMMVSFALPTPQYINLHGADEDKVLAEAEADIKESQRLVGELKQQTGETDDQFAKRKAGYMAELHADMGMIHLDRAQLSLVGSDLVEVGKAIDEYKLAVSITDKPDPSAYFRMGDAYRLENKLDDAIAAYGKASELGQGALKQYADRQVEATKQLKAQSGAK